MLNKYRPAKILLKFIIILLVEHWKNMLYGIIFSSLYVSVHHSLQPKA